MTAFPNPEEFYRETRLYRAWKHNEQPSQLSENLDELSAAEAATAEARVTFEQAEEQAWSEIEIYIRTMPPYEFQYLVADLLEALDYHISWVSPPARMAASILSRIPTLSARKLLGSRFKLNVSLKGSIYKH